MLIWIILGTIPFIGKGQISLSKIFTNNMVLQRDKPIVIWGKGNPQDFIKVTLCGKSQTTKVQTDGTWKIRFQAMPASSLPQTLTVKAPDTTIILQNILVGDLWLCLGQSNMEWPMVKEQHFQEEIQKFKEIPLRFYNATYAGKNMYGSRFSDSTMLKLQPTTFYSGYWEVNDTSTFKTMSAVGYYFGKEIVKNTNIPIGLINLSIGGAPIETFIDPVVLKTHPHFKSKMEGDWLENDHLPEWIRLRAKENIGFNNIVPQDVNGKNHAFKPGFAFVAGIQSLSALAIKGIIFYQGESNAQEKDRILEYRELSKLMIKSYRDLWKNKKLPFYYAQLSSIDTTQYKGHLWPIFRDEQRKLMKELPNLGMAITADHGMKNDVHPRNKKIVGERLALWALNSEYNKNNITFGPQPIKTSYKNKILEIFFDQPLSISNGQEVRGFSLSNASNIQAVISGNKVKIVCENKPEYVYYNWSPYSNGNLTNHAQLPTSTFKINVK
jgi:sialate O-acetylesterase